MPPRQDRLQGTFETTQQCSRPHRSCLAAKYLFNAYLCHSAVDFLSSYPDWSQLTTIRWGYFCLLSTKTVTWMRESEREREKKNTIPLSDLTTLWGSSPPFKKGDFSKSHSNQRIRRNTKVAISTLKAQMPPNYDESLVLSGSVQLRHLRLIASERRGRGGIMNKLQRLSQSWW